MIGQCSKKQQSPDRLLMLLHPLFVNLVAAAQIDLFGPFFLRIQPHVFRLFGESRR